ncbi:MAG: hypothetical protein M3256_02045 [Actinomycetota bacterium]|nr:hypothetical protein [Actinomycetota bacterium]
MGSDQRIVPPGQGKQHQFRPGELFTWKTLGPAMDFGELSVDPAVGVPQHIHHGNDEAYYVLAGTVQIQGR